MKKTFIILFLSLISCKSYVENHSRGHITRYVDLTDAPNAAKYIQHGTSTSNADIYSMDSSYSLDSLYRWKQSPTDTIIYEMQIDGNDTTPDLIATLCIDTFIICDPESDVTQQMLPIRLKDDIIDTLDIVYTGYYIDSNGLHYNKDSIK